jgi:hypothetical protein
MRRRFPAAIAALLVGTLTASALIASAGCGVRLRSRGRLARALAPDVSKPQKHADVCGNFPAEQVSAAVGSPVELQAPDPNAPASTVSGKVPCVYGAPGGGAARVTVTQMSPFVTAPSLPEYREKLKGDAVYSEDVPGIDAEHAFFVADRGWLFVRVGNWTYKVEGEPALTLPQAKAVIFGPEDAAPPQGG